MRKTLVICLALLVLASVTALAATKDTTITINGGTTTVAMQPPTHFYAAAQRSTKLKKIYSNLGTGTNVYAASLGWTVSAGQWVAMPFRPKTASVVKQIDIAVGYTSGTNEIIISLAADNKGVPGKTLREWHHKAMYTFGNCCALDTVKSPEGIKVGTKRYWVTVTTVADSDFSGEWNYTWNLKQGLFALDLGSGWQPSTSGTVSAFDVLGE
jgi:hypothetical protein